MRGLISLAHLRSATDQTVMWELIRANKRNSIVLMVVMAVVLLLVGFVIGLAWFGPEGGLFGLMIATAIWLVMMLVSFSSGDQILLAASKATEVTHDVHPQLFNVVEEMKMRATRAQDKRVDMWPLNKVNRTGRVLYAAIR